MVIRWKLTRPRVLYESYRGYDLPSSTACKFKADPKCLRGEGAVVPQRFTRLPTDAGYGRGRGYGSGHKEAALVSDFWNLFLSECAE